MGIFFTCNGLLLNSVQKVSQSFINNLPLQFTHPEKMCSRMCSQFNVEAAVNYVCILLTSARHTIPCESSRASLVARKGETSLNI